MLLSPRRRDLFVKRRRPYKSALFSFPKTRTGVLLFLSVPIRRSRCVEFSGIRVSSDGEVGGPQCTIKVREDRAKRAWANILSEMFTLEKQILAASMIKHRFRFKKRTAARCYSQK